ncbi:hypothetical protein EV179_006517, partial [Coemansia sp. RSA 487]
RLRKVLQDSGEKKCMPTILTIFMCQMPADIASALQLLAPLSTNEHDDALTYLLSLSDADTVYNAALGLKRHSDICIEYGDHLANTSDWAQAAAVYLLGNTTRQAVSAFVQAKEWRMAPVLAAALGSGFDT